MFFDDRNPSAPLLRGVVVLQTLARLLRDAGCAGCGCCVCSEWCKCVRRQARAGSNHTITHPLLTFDDSEEVVIAAGEVAASSARLGPVLKSLPTCRDRGKQR